MDNHWVGHSVMKPVDAEFFQRRKYIKDGGDMKNDNHLSKLNYWVGHSVMKPVDAEFFSKKKIHQRWR